MTPHAMTPHLTPDELIDSRDRQLAPARQAHADACVVCRTKLAELDEVLRDVAAADVPEPSPLFWDHLSARIRERVAHEPPPAPARDNPLSRLTDWLTGWSAAPRWAFAAVVLVLCASLGWLGWSELRRGGKGALVPGPGPAPTTASTAPTATTVPEATVATETSAAAADDADGEWALMLQMAEDVSWDDTEGSSMYVRPAAVDRALIELSAEERDRLLQLVQADLARQNQRRNQKS
jgi:hypothetical protein